MSTGQCIPIPVLGTVCAGTGTVLRFWPTVLPVRNPTHHEPSQGHHCAHHHPHHQSQTVCSKNATLTVLTYSREVNPADDTAATDSPSSKSMSTIVSTVSSVAASWGWGYLEVKVAISSYHILLQWSYPPNSEVVHSLACVGAKAFGQVWPFIIRDSAVSCSWTVSLVGGEMQLQDGITLSDFSRCFVFHAMCHPHKFL